LSYPENREILPEPHCLKGSKLQPAEIIFVSGPEQEARSTQEIHNKIHKIEVLVMPSFFQTHNLLYQQSHNSNLFFLFPLLTREIYFLRVISLQEGALCPIAPSTHSRTKSRLQI
jgi:hypothetical protein